MCDPGVTIRPAHPSDRTALAAARAELWPNATREEHEAELAAILAGEPLSTLPQAILFADAAGVVVGFVEIGQRSHADGCDSRRPVAFVEGWYVAPDMRRRGIGRALINAAEHWGRSYGCTEMASDTWIDHTISQRAHEAIGFAVVDRCVHYRKPL
jgi:aminoglycoside 6'-N-acetyltransferase I